MVKKVIGFALLLSLVSACKGDSSVTEIRDEGDLLGAVGGSSAADVILSAGLAIDLDERIHVQRKAWFVKNMIALADSSVASSETESHPCQMSLPEAGGAFPLKLEEKTAYALPQGRVVYCLDGRLAWATQDNSLRERLVNLGMDAAELEKVNFYRVPVDIPDAFATVHNSDEASIVLFDGVAQFSRQNALDADSVVAGVLAHQLGRVRDLRKDNQAVLKAAQERLRSACLVKPASNASAAESRAVRSENCRKNIQANSRQALYSADQFVADVVGRKRYAAGLRPTELGKYFRLQSTTSRDPLDAHPDPTERAIQFERNLERVGINILTGGVLRPGEADARVR